MKARTAGARTFHLPFSLTHEACTDPLRICSSSTVLRFIRFICDSEFRGSQICCVGMKGGKEDGRMFRRVEARASTALGRLIQCTVSSHV